jgi:hypothetical protein
VTNAGYWMWLAIFLAAAVFEGWAIQTGHQTLSQTVQRGPLWFAYLLAGSFGVLLVHLFSRWS